MQALNSQLVGQLGSSSNPAAGGGLLQELKGIALASKVRKGGGVHCAGALGGVLRQGSVCCSHGSPAPEDQGAHPAPRTGARAQAQAPPSQQADDSTASDAAALVVHAMYLAAKIRDVVSKQWQIVRASAPTAPTAPAAPTGPTGPARPHLSAAPRTTDEPPARGQLRRMQSSKSRRLSFDGTEMPAEGGSNSGRLRQVALQAAPEQGADVDMSSL